MGNFCDVWTLQHAHDTLPAWHEAIWASVLKAARIGPDYRSLGNAVEGMKPEVPMQIVMCPVMSAMLPTVDHR